MSKKTKEITLTSLISALTIVILYVASVWPTGQIGLVAVAAVFTSAAVIEAGMRPGIFVYIVSSLLGLLLIPERSAVILYIIFFGYYPVAKSLIERIPQTIAQWILKLAVFNAAFTVVLFSLRALLLAGYSALPGAPVLYLGGNVVFIAFDYGFSKLIWLYINRISKYVFKGSNK